MKHNSIPPVSGFICGWSHLTNKTKLYLVKPYMRKSINQWLKGVSKVKTREVKEKKIFSSDPFF